MEQSNFSLSCRRRLDIISYVAGAMSEKDVRNALRFAKSVGKDYAKQLVDTGGVETTFSSLRKLSIARGFEWVESGYRRGVFDESLAEELVAGAEASFDNLLANPSFRNREQLDTVSVYFAQAALAVMLEDLGFGSAGGDGDIEILRTAWSSIFGDSVFSA